MTGWATPPAPGPIVGWELPSEPAGLGVRDSIRAGWRVLRSNVGPLAGTAALPEIVRNLLVIPSLLVVARAWEAMVAIFRDLDLRTYEPNDQLAMQQRLQQAFQPPTDLAILSGVASGLSIGVALVGLSLVTAATLAAVDGRRPSIAAAYRSVAAHAGALILPAVILGVAWVIVGTPLTLSQGTFPTSDPAAFRTQAALAAVLGLAGLILTIATIVFAVRWSLAIPAILAEDLTLRRGLSRSAELTAGIRLRIFVILLVLGITFGIVFGVTSLITAVIVGLVTFSLYGGIAGYLVASTVGGFVWLPLVAAVLSHVYRSRAGSPASMDGPEEIVEPDAAVVDPTTSA